MAMLITKVQKEAPELADTYQKVGKMLMSKGVNPNRDQAAVVAFYDHSGSTESGPNRLYSGSEMPGGKSVMRHVSDLVLCGGLFFDDDGNVPSFLFDTGIHELGDTTLQNYQHVLDQHTRWNYGGTSYMCVLRKVLQLAGYNEGMLRGGGLSVKATAPYPTYAAVVTDGEPVHDNERDIIALLTAMSQLPIYVQFIGVGEHRFSFLKQLDKLKGRLIDNAGFFDAKDTHGQDDFLERMLSEFAASYYPGARAKGLLTA